MNLNEFKRLSMKMWPKNEYHDEVHILNVEHTVVVVSSKQKR